MFIDFEWTRALDHLLRILFAFAQAFPIGWERQKGKASAGFRTFPVVAMASCGYTLLVSSLPDHDSESLSRLLQGLIAGIGFIGGGAILKEGRTVHGLATAASIWNTGAIGSSIALDRAEIAIVLSAVNVVALLLLTPLSPDHDGDAAE